MSTATRERVKSQSVRRSSNAHYDPKHDSRAIWPWLPCALGLEKAHIISQLHYWLENPNAGYYALGFKWVWNGYKEWVKQLPWFSVDQFGRHIRQLEDMGLIITDNFHNNPDDRRKWYRIDYQKLYEVTGWNPKGLPKLSAPDPTSPEPSELQRFEELVKTIDASLTQTLEPSVEANMQNYRMVSGILHNTICNWRINIYKDYPYTSKSFFTDKKKKEEKTKEVELPHYDEDVNNHKEALDNTISVTTQHSVQTKSSGRRYGRVISEYVISEREPYEWEVFPQVPHQYFIQWRADNHYKPQGGHWASDALGHAAAEIIKKTESLPWAVKQMWQSFLQFANRTADAVSAVANNSDSVFSLPNCLRDNTLDTTSVVGKLKQAVEVVKQRETRTLETSQLAALPAPELSPEEKAKQDLLNKLAMYKAQWNAFWDKPHLKKMVEAVIEKVQKTPGLIMTEDGPALASDLDCASPTTTAGNPHGEGTAPTEQVFAESDLIKTDMAIDPETDKPEVGDRPALLENCISNSYEVASQTLEDTNADLWVEPEKDRVERFIKELEQENIIPEPPVKGQLEPLEQLQKDCRPVPHEEASEPCAIPSAGVQEANSPSGLKKSLNKPLPKS